MFADQWVTGGILARFSRILSTYHLSWVTLDTTTSIEDWKLLVTDRVNHELLRLCQTAQDEYHLYSFVPPADPALLPRPPLLPPPLPTLDQPLPAYLRHSYGDLARAALRFRYSKLRALPGPPTRFLGLCRYCRVGPENGEHLLQCPHLPPTMVQQRDAIYALIVVQAGRRWSTTRASIDLGLAFMLSLRWPHQSHSLLRRVLAFFRLVINNYARYPAPWEGNLSASYFVRPVRPPALKQWEVPEASHPAEELE